MKNIVLLILVTTLFADYGQNLDNPCEDQTFLNLKSKNLDDMTEREYEYYMQKSKECSEYQKINREVQSQDKFVQNQNTWTSFYIIVSVISLLLTFTIY